jgi:hypothetical protein
VARRAGELVQTTLPQGGRILEDAAMEPPFKPGTLDPYTPPRPGELRPEEHIQIGPVTQFVTTLVRAHDTLPDPHHGSEHQSG